MYLSILVLSFTLTVFTSSSLKRTGKHNLLQLPFFSWAFIIFLSSLPQNFMQETSSLKTSIFSPSTRNSLLGTFHLQALLNKFSLKNELWLPNLQNHWRSFQNFLWYLTIFNCTLYLRLWFLSHSLTLPPSMTSFPLQVQLCGFS